ncbi:MAG: hypothetical protein VB018_13570 [Lachnospiraceae bacterium]|nr:hypothetical protein [Lachnospiraceae bacterium]
MIYIIAFLAIVILYWKEEWFRKFIDFSQLLGTRKAKIICIIRCMFIFIFIYAIFWSVVNYWFYINLFILHEKLNYSWIQSITIASNLTNELASFTYYILLFFENLLGNDFYNSIMQQMQPQIDSILASYGQLSELNSSVDAFSSFMKIFL